MIRDYGRVLLAAGAALLVLPACDDDDDGNSGGPLFSDTFSRQAVGSDWTTSSTSGTMTIDGAAGSPGGGLSMSVGRPNDVSSAQTTMVFPGRPVTFSVDLAASSSGAGVGGVQVVDDRGGVVASAEQAAAGGFTFDIGGDRQTLPSAGGNGFQTLTFNVDEQGNGTWSADGSQAITRSGIPSVPLSVRLFTRGNDVPPTSSRFPTFTFDNVRVTTP